MCGFNPLISAMVKRTCPTDLSYDVAIDLFRMHVPLDLSPKTLWQYEVKKATTKPGVQWAFVAKSRRMLSDVLDKSGGRVLKQSMLHSQFRSYLVQKGLIWSIADSEAPIYRLRTMLSGLLKHKSSNRKPPRAYENLNSLLDKMHVSDDEGEEGGAAGGQDDESVVEVPTPDDEAAEVVDVSSDDAAAEPMPCSSHVDEHYIDDLSSRLFASPPKPASPRTPAPLPRTFGVGDVSAEKEPQQLHLLGPKELANVIGSCSAPAPVPQEYRAAFPAMKRPAAAPKAASSSRGATVPEQKKQKLVKHFSIQDLVDMYPVSTDEELKSVKKRVHSRLWHAEDDRGKANGVDASERHAAVTRAAKEGVLQWLAAIGR